MKITKTENGKEVTLSLDGWLDTSSAPQLQEQTSGAASRENGCERALFERSEF